MGVIWQRFSHPRCVDFSSPATFLIGSKCRGLRKTGKTYHLRVVSSKVEVMVKWWLKWTGTSCDFGIMNRNGWPKRLPRVAGPSSTNFDGDCSGYRAIAAGTHSALPIPLLITFHAHFSRQSEAQWNYSKAQEDSPYPPVSCARAVPISRTRHICSRAVGSVGHRDVGLLSVLDDFRSCPFCER